MKCIKKLKNNQSFFLFLFSFFSFIDYIKAFDSVQRGLLWGKMLNSSVNGKVLCVIRDMYAKAKSCVKTRHDLSLFS